MNENQKNNLRTLFTPSPLERVGERLPFSRRNFIRTAGVSNHDWLCRIRNRFCSHKR